MMVYNNNRYQNDNLNEGNYYVNNFYNQNEQKNNFRASQILQNNFNNLLQIDNNYNNNNFSYTQESIGYNNNLNGNYNGVNINISYKNKYEDFYNKNQREKKEYGNILLEQVKLNNLKKKIELENKKRQDLLDELRIEKERKELEIQEQKEKNKRFKYITNRFSLDSELLEKQLKKSEEDLKNFEIKINKKNIHLNKSKSTKIKLTLSLEDKLKYERIKSKISESQIYNKEIFNDFEILKLTYNDSLDILKKELIEAKHENNKSNYYKNIILKDLNQLRNEVRLRNINSKFVTDYIINEHLYKMNQPKILGEQRKLNELPIIDYNKDFLNIEKNINKTYVNCLNNDNNEIDYMSKRVDLSKIRNLNENRLKDLTFVEEREIN